MKVLTLIFITLLFASTSWATDLSTATLKQLVNQRPDLIQDIKAGKDEGSSTVSVVKDAKGRMGIWTEERKDLDGVVTSKRVDTYSYYLTGELNEIIQEKYTGKVLKGKKRVKHFRDGRQPTMEIMSIEIPIGP